MTLDDLGIRSIADLSYDEAIELLRQIRLRRRAPKSKSKTDVKNKQKFDTSNLTESQINELLKLLEVNKR